MQITMSEQRELADLIAKRIGRRNLADDIWFAIEDYVASDPDSPDILALAKARLEGEFMNAICVCCANGQHGSHLIGAKCDCVCHASNQRKAKKGLTGDAVRAGLPCEDRPIFTKEKKECQS